MKLSKLMIIAAIVTMMTTSCIKRIPKTDSNTKMIESIDGPRAIKDTPIKEIEVEKNVDETDIIQTQEAEPVPAPKVAPAVRNTRSTTATTSSRRDDDRIDPNNSGFFDRYEQNWDGDPNRNMKTTTRTVQPQNNNNLEREKQQIAKSIELLEKQNQQNKAEFEQRQREIELKNQREIERARQEEQQQKQKQKAPKGKTLDTDPLLNDRYR